MPVPVDRAPARCAELTGRLVDEWGWTPAPLTGPQTIGGLKAAIDARDVAIDAKNRVGRQLVGEYVRCRTGGGAPTS